MNGEFSKNATKRGVREGGGGGKGRAMRVYKRTERQTKEKH